MQAAHMRGRMHTIEDSIEVNAPIRVCYNQWTQFEEFPEFMEGVQAVRQVDDKTLDWRTNVGGKEHEFRAEITEQQPDRVVAWRSIRGRQHAGSVRFEQINPNETLVRVQMTYDTEGFIEKAGDALGVMKMRVKGDLKRFKEFIEDRGRSTGAWRGHIEGGQVRQGGSTTQLGGGGTYGGTTGGMTGGGTTGGGSLGGTTGGRDRLP